MNQKQIEVNNVQRHCSCHCTSDMEHPFR